MKNSVLFGLGAFIIFVWFCFGPERLDSAWALSQEVKVEEVEVRAAASGPVVLLKVEDRAIPVYVDPIVAGSIQGALSGKKFSRPLSHDLMASILSAYEVKVQQVFITLRNGVFYGTLTLLHDGQVQLFDSRSSDAIALAIHFESPIFVEQKLVDSAGIKLGVLGANQERMEL